MTEQIILLFQFYKMTDAIRGRVMIINIMNFNNSDLYKKRTGSDVDYKNLVKLFKDLRFDIVKSEKDLTDLTEEVLKHT